MEKIKVSGMSKPASVAGAIAGIIRNGNEVVEIQAIGAGAVNQGIKAIAIARGFLASSGVDLVCVPSFTNVVVNGDNKSAVILKVRVQK